jgi:hypothetical protein
MPIIETTSRAWTQVKLEEMNFLLVPRLAHQLKQTISYFHGKEYQLVELLTLL